VLVTGGAGYIGSVLVPELLDAGYRVSVLDRMIFGDRGLAGIAGHPGLRVVRGDLRDHGLVADLLGSEHPFAVVHLAAISNDPSAELDEAITESINGAACVALMHAAEAAGVERFLYASSASVYGIADAPDVTEDLPLAPITLYARKKAEGEAALASLCGPGFCGVSVRSATVCGLSPRIRLDLTVNLLSDQALRRGRLRVLGGEQMRPNVHVRDLTRFYRLLLDADPGRVRGRAFNVCRENASVLDIARAVRDEVDPAMPIDIAPTDDRRSYHLTAARAEGELGFSAALSLRQAIGELRDAYRRGQVEDPDDDRHRNVRWMQAHPESWRA
jgi:nucleoside-diphosphate-sugar epimerase